ncbi:MAG: hypothetical protein AAF267_17825 [Deinococcota bacterium]
MLQRTKPIIFTADSVNAILDDHKTETRRLIKPQFTGYAHKSVFHKSGYCTPHGDEIKLRYGLGDVLWVRETWADPNDVEIPVYKADNATAYQSVTWKSPIYMPKKFARIKLCVVGIGVRRIQDMTDRDAIAEGIVLKGITNYEGKARKQFSKVWDSLHAKPKPVYETYLDCGDAALDDYRYTRKVSHYVSYPWKSCEGADYVEYRCSIYRGKPWHIYPNPLVQVIRFEVVK